MNIKLNQILGSSIRSIKGKVNTVFVSSEMIFDEIVIECADYFLVILPLTDTDEIKFLLEKELSDYQDITDFISEDLEKIQCSEIWESYNSRGYFDQLLISFSNLRPSIAILSEGSVLKIFKIEILKNPIKC